MELEPSTNFTPTRDARRFIPPPPPVSLLTVEDARLPAAAGLERALEAFYGTLLEFERDGKFDGLAFKAENFRIVFEVIEPPVQRDDLRMLGVVVKSLGDTMRKLREAEIAFSRERGLNLGDERVVLLDPAGNWIRVVQSKPIM